MAILSKEKALFIRDADGKLTPQTIVLELLDDQPEAQVIPLTRAELQRLGKNYETKEGEKLSDEDVKKADQELIVKHFHNPHFEAEEVKDLKPYIANAMLVALLSLTTGTPQKEISEQSKATAVGDALKK